VGVALGPGQGESGFNWRMGFNFYRSRFHNKGKSSLKTS
jgi:hypothetical protein